MSRRRIAALVACLLLVQPVAPAIATVAGSHASGAGPAAGEAGPPAQLQADAPALSQAADSVAPPADASAMAQADDPGAARENAPAADDPGAIVDDLVEEAMADDDVAGATVAVVQDGEVVHTNGHGYADSEADEPVVAEETRFKVGSVSKLFVWTTVMQGVEEGRLDLDAPVDDYLADFGGDTDGVTLEHLGTHTPGYEDRIEGLFVRDAAAIEEWEAKLERELPARVREPGETVAYSNHGTALAGYAVAESADEPFEAHVERQVFGPLEMDDATFAQPVEDGPVSQGHVPTDDGFETRDPVVVGVPPAGSMAATADDMGNFMIAALGDGAYEDERILEAGTLDEMYAERTTNHPGVQGIGYGYLQMDYGGERIVGHTGGTEYFLTLLMLFPERDLGVFVSVNTPTVSPMEFRNEFVEAYTGDGDGGAGNGGGASDGARSGADVAAGSIPAERADEYEGEYRTTAFQTTYEKLLGIQDRVVVSVDDGDLVTDRPGSGTNRWHEVEPGVFEPAPGSDATSSAVAIEGDRLYVDGPAAPYERLSWYERTTVQVALLGVFALATVSPLLVWPINAYRHRGDGPMRRYVTASRPRLAVLVGSLLAVAFVGGVVATLAVDPLQIVYGKSLSLRLALALAPLFGLATLGAVAATALEWRRPDEGRPDRLGWVYLGAVLLAFVGLLWQLWYWNLLTAAV